MIFLSKYPKKYSAIRENHECVMVFFAAVKPENVIFFVKFKVSDTCKFYFSAESYYYYRIHVGWFDIK